MSGKKSAKKVKLLLRLSPSESAVILLSRLGREIDRRPLPDDRRLGRAILPTAAEVLEANDLTPAEVESFQLESNLPPESLSARVARVSLRIWESFSRL
ncbi:MAG TPA: hypothetical protein ENJ77_00595 [Candidatus Moranbacteria bacterium]|nr:hypothetical protein [Candidatus Moranbacteria bacterium]